MVLTVNYATDGEVSHSFRTTNSALQASTKPVLPEGERGRGARG